MGSNQSSTVQDTISEFNQNVNNITQNVTNASSASCNVVQNTSVNNYGNLFGCTFDVAVSARNVCDLSASSTQTSGADLISQLQSAAQATASSTNTATSDFLSTTFSNQNSNTSISSAISNIIENNISSSDLTTCVAQAGINQQGAFNNYGNIYCPTSKPVINWGSDAQQQLVANCLSNSVINAVSQNTAVMSAISTATSANTSTSTGLGSVISAALSAYQNVIIAVAAICALVLIGVLIFGGYILLSPAGQQSITTATDAAASMAGNKYGGGKAGGGKAATMAFSSNRRFISNAGKFWS